MADSTGADESAPPKPPGKRERLIAAACDLFYRQGIAGTTLAHIAEAAEVPLGNMYYYFKTKDDIVAAVVEARTEEIRSATAALQRRHGSPKARLKALVGTWPSRATRSPTTAARWAPCAPSSGTSQANRLP
jgi:AcrR family transcriptional regulator